MLLEELVTELNIEDREVIKYLDLIGNNNKFNIHLFKNLDLENAKKIIHYLNKKTLIEISYVYSCSNNWDVLHIADSETSNCDLCGAPINTQFHRCNEIYTNTTKNILLEIEKYQKGSVLSIVDEKYFKNVSDLKKEISNKNAIPFLGAGISIPLGLPNWQGLIQICEDGLSGRDKEEFSKKLTSGDIFSAIDIILQTSVTYNDVAIRKKISEYIRKHLNVFVDESSHNIKDVLSIKPDFYITTNYDDALSKINEQSTYPIVIEDIDDVQSFKELKDGQVLHFHGIFHRPKTMIISRQDYENLYSEDKLQLLLANIISYKFVFIGFSFEDQYFKDLFTLLKKHLGGKHFIILFDAYDRDVQVLKEEYNLHAISLKPESETGLNRVQSLKKILTYLTD